MKRTLSAAVVTGIVLLLFPGCGKTTPAFVAPDVPTPTPAVTMTGPQKTETAQAQKTAAAIGQTATAVVREAEAASARHTATAVASIPYSEMAEVPGGTFTQIDLSLPGDVLTHAVSSFKIGKYEVTYELWHAVKEWAVKSGYSFPCALHREGNKGQRNAAPSDAKHHPVTNISWYDAVVWCNAYSEVSGLAPVYFSDPEHTVAVRFSVCFLWAGEKIAVYPDWASAGYRLPTEGEWEYASRYKDGLSMAPGNYASGAEGPYTDCEASGAVAWFSYNSGGTTAGAGAAGRTANGLGIYNMSGNVFEWCWDIHGQYPSQAVDYRGPGNLTGYGRVVRGGWYGGADKQLQTGYRPDSGIHPNFISDSTGFRVAKY